MTDVADQLVLFAVPLGARHPVLGRKVKVDFTCVCGASTAVITAGKGPHAAMLRCYGCDRHVQWLSHPDYSVIAKSVAEIENRFGAPPEITYRLRQHQPNKQETEMAYDSLRGALFRNTDKAKETDRDYSGEVNVDGRLFWISGWVNTSKAGAKYLAITLKPKDQPATPTKSRADEMSDSIPF